MRRMKQLFPVLLVAILSGCATLPPKDYTALRKSNPHSILVLPPLNESTDVRATYSLLTTTTHPLAELGYYVFPVAMVDHYFKENGLNLAGEMHEVSLPKLREVFGADAVLYITIQEFGSKYQVLASNTIVKAKANLVDCQTGVKLWEGSAQVVYSGQSGLLEAVVTQILNKVMDQAHGVAAMASTQLLVTPTQGLLKGPRHPEYGKN